MGDSDGPGGRGPRSIALVGPFQSGKTTLLEAILARTDARARQGTVAEGTCLGDGTPEARAHSMSVEINCAETQFLGETMSFIDCPGSIEFQSETSAALSVVDAAVVVCEPDEKKVPALQVILRELEERGIPHFLFLNKIDRASARVREILSLLQPASARPLVLRQIPIWENGIATGYVDLALERAHLYREHAPSVVIDMPADMVERESEARFNMLEKLADYDDELMEQLLSDMQPPRDKVFEDLARELQEGLICPVLFGSAEHGNGIVRLLKALRHEAPTVEKTAERLGLGGGKSAVHVFKTLHTPHGGRLSVARVLAGELAETATLTSGDQSNRIAGLATLMGQDVRKRGAAVAGDVVAIVRLDGAKTGDTLSADGTKPPMVATMPVPQPVFARALSVADRKDEVKLTAALQKIIEEDPALRLDHDQDLHELVLHGQGDMHLRVALEKLQRKFGVTATASKPRIAYRETIRKSTEVRGRHKKQSGGHGQFGDVVLRIAPLPRGGGFEFSDTITGGVVPKQYISSVEAGARESLARGPLGFQVVDVSVVLTDGSYHTVDSSDMAFKTAARIGMSEGLPQCSPVLLEPLMAVTVVCPSEATARINAIISGRRGQILGFDTRAGWLGWDQVEAHMPAAEIGDLIVEIRSATSGVGTFTNRFDHLSELTGRLADQVIEAQTAAAA
ncbi:MAG: elongation factor G [Rhizobiales bacterium]|nr:elongation factor G [Hyphomicrobiales bacterium]